MLATCATLPSSPYALSLYLIPRGSSSFSKLVLLQQRKLPSLRRTCPSIQAAIAYTDDKTADIDDKLCTQQDPKTSEKIPTIRDICSGMLPDEFLQRAEDLGFSYLTDVQAQALPALLSGHDCILHSQTGSGKTLCYLLAILAKVNQTRAAVQAIVVVPTRELGMQVVREARKLGKRSNTEEKDKPSSSLSTGCLNVMALLDGGSLSRQKSWLKADPPAIVVGTLPCICKMIETKNLRTNAVNTLVIDEVDAMFGLTQHAGLLRTLLTTFTKAQNRQTIFASATIPQHSQFIRKCISEKWVKDNVIHVQANEVNKMPVSLLHRHVVCGREQKLDMLNAVLCADKPKAAIIFVNEQSEASKRKGHLPSAEIVADFLASSCLQDSDGNSSHYEPLVLKEESNINARACTLAVSRAGVPVVKLRAVMYGLMFYVQFHFAQRPNATQLFCKRICSYYVTVANSLKGNSGLLGSSFSSSFFCWLYCLNGVQKEDIAKGNAVECLLCWKLSLDSLKDALTFSLKILKRQDFPDEKSLLIATDLAGRGLDIPEVTHVYNFDLPPTATAYVHRGGRTARKPLNFNEGTVTTFVTEEELFVFQRYQNEIMFQSRLLEMNYD